MKSIITPNWDSYLGKFISVTYDGMQHTSIIPDTELSSNT